MRRSVMALLVLAASAPVALAQADTGPKAGTWGAEAAFGPNASLLKFRSPTSAWVLNVLAFYTQQNTDGLRSSDRTFINTELRLGRRTYARPEERTRPYHTVSAIVGYNDSGSFQRGWVFGGAVEMGAAYFVTPYASLGAAGDLSATYSAFKEDFGTPEKVRIISVRFSGFRLMGGVYF